ncbi:type IV pilus twitching motility protein PilT [Moraxella sp. ZJ142]|uniref:type IV pilus twitching motility protein PilT n=1 Tax=Moraxella marmotae TaxID=3344520 RepID=UPI0035D51892
MSVPNLLDLLSFSHAKGASDLHLSAGSPVMLRLDGELMPVGIANIHSDGISQMLRSVMTAADFEIWQTTKEHDFAISVSLQGVAVRFRVNAFFTHKGAAAVFRTIPSRIASLDELCTDATILHSLHAIAKLKSGLVLVTGATGSGKSTTLAAIINHINRHKKSHILTIEDPIEFVHECQLSLINQRQVGADTTSFEQALRSALREDPDVILVGELRDLQTIRLALRAAETGHLVLATLHTMNAPKSIDRIVDVFDSHEKHLIRTMLADSLQAIVAQRLLPATTGGRVAVFEILLHTPAVANLIRENKLAQLPSVIQTGIEQGMISLDYHLDKLLSQGKISRDTAKEYAQALQF